MYISGIFVRPLYTFIGALAFAVVAAVVVYFALQERDVESGVYRIVNIEARDNGIATGTGFKVAEPGVVVTNFHVVRGAEKLFAQFRKGGDVETVPMRVIWQDDEQDIAVLRSLSELPGEILELANITDDELHKKDDVEAIGYPGAADDLALISSNGKMNSADSATAWTDATVSTGTVQRLVHGSTRLTIQHSANVNSGNSGGPLLDACQRVVGVNTLSKSASINVQSVDDARKKGGVVYFQTPGALEASVHIREVLAALKEENIAPISSSGRCRAGVTSSEFWSAATSSALSLCLFSLTGFAVIVRGRNIATMGGYETSQYSVESGGEGYTEIYEPESGGGVEVETLELIRKSDRSRVDLLPFEPFIDGAGVSIGREGGGAEITFDDSTISRKHAVIMRHHGGDLIIQDLKSTNGTTVDGIAVEGDQPRPIKHGSIVILGSCEFEARLRRKSSSSPTQESSGWRLSGFDGDGRVFQFTIPKTGIQNGQYIELGTIGRSADNDCVIDDASVSRKHAAIVLDKNNRLRIIDLNSSNGTFVDGHKVGAKPLIIEDSKKLQFGEIFASISQIY